MFIDHILGSIFLFKNSSYYVLLLSLNSSPSSLFLLFVVCFLLFVVRCLLFVVSVVAVAVVVVVARKSPLHTYIHPPCRFWRRAPGGETGAAAGRFRWFVG